MARSCVMRGIFVAAAMLACATSEVADNRAGDAVMSFDDECSESGDMDCVFSALQHYAALQSLETRDVQEPNARTGGSTEGPEASHSESTEAEGSPAAPAVSEHVTMLSCQGPWCKTVNEFNALFDTNDPAKMQQAVDMYSEWPAANMGIMVGVTKDHFYEMYHGNVKAKLAEYLPQGMFAWGFGDRYKLFQRPSPENGNEAVVVRDGTITFALGWWRRSMFWNAVVRPLGAGRTFPYSSVEDFDDCDRCAAELSYTLKKGGLDGTEGDRWVIVGLAVVKMA